MSGWSGGGTRKAPLLAPGDSFTAHPTLRRAGTFIYHTHVNDLHRLRFVFIGLVNGHELFLRTNDGLVKWRTLAHDGCEMSSAAQHVVDAKVALWAGQPFDLDFDLLPNAPREYTLIATRW